MPKIVDHVAYRQQLLTHCFRLFAQKGYSAITMRQMAAGLGVSTGTLYHYFPSKQTIFEQIMLDRVEVSIRQFDADLGNLESIREKIFGLFDYFKQEEKAAIDELFLYIEYHQQQQREAQPNHLIHQIFGRLKPQAARLLGTDDPQIIQFVFSIIDGLLLAQIYGQTIDWPAQAAIVSTLLETLISRQRVIP
jgi:AcrR family transcriptional regulator